ncbi:DUF7282 domain-containing protein [Halobacterium yunchengense]|uniref:DUF7282 domain-containing protein n=1 Tax=Halobacterium yunchengense TaxID=3108497 RepID=UPI00300BB584
MLDRKSLRTLGVALVVLTSVAAAGPLVASAATDGDITADPATTGSDATHSVSVTVDGDAAGSSWNSLVVDYGDGGADVSNVGQGDLVAVGIDRGDDSDGTTVDESVASDVSSVSASDDGSTLTVGFGGNYQLQQGDELVVVYEGAQNPGSAGDSQVELTVNEQSAATSASATLSVEAADDGADDGTDDGAEDGTDDGAEDGTDDGADDGTDDETDCECVGASVAFDAQTSNGSTVTVDEVTLSEGGFVAIYDESGDLVGHSAYLSPGTHEDVTVSLDEELSGDATLDATAHCDTDGDEEFDEDCDESYTDDGDVVSDAAEVDVTEEC